MLKSLSSVAPSIDRWHQHATPTLGGVPVFLAFLAGTLVANNTTFVTTTIIVSALPLLVLGTYDDIKPVSPLVKISIQLLSTLLFLVLVSILGSKGISDNSIATDLTSPLHAVLSLFWILGIINAINLLDNMDGLAGGVALIACITIAYLAHQSNALQDVSILYFVLAAALAGFLILNHNPAKLFMGDAGTLWVGFVIAVGTLIVMPFQDNSVSPHQTVPFPFSWLVPIAVCIVPISDTLMVMVTRKMRGQPFWVGGRDHLSHRLVSLGLSDRMSVGILWLAAVATSLLALPLYFHPLSVSLIPACIFIVLLATAVIWLVHASSSTVPTISDQ